MRMNPLAISACIQAGLYIACIGSNRHGLAAAAAAGALLNLIFIRAGERKHG